MTLERLEHVVCPFCGCLCDDLAVTVHDGQITALENACPLATRAYAAFPRPAQPPALVAGEPADQETALRAAAELLRAARNPLVYGLSGVSTEAQRMAVALADALRANLDTTAGATQGAAADTLGAGYAHSATLGEVRNLADLIIYWGADPTDTHPRHITRYTAPLDRRRERTLIVIDEAPTALAAQADLFVACPPGRDYELIAALRGLLRGLPTGPALAEAAGIPLETLTELVAQLRRCKYGAIYYSARLGAGRDGTHTVAALTALVTELNAHTRMFVQGLGGNENAAGADNALAWQTGYPQSVSFGRGHPRANAGEFSAGELLTRGEVDAVLVVAADPTAGLTAEAAACLKQLPTVVIGPGASGAAWARVAIATAVVGVEAGGTLYRMDEVALTARAIWQAPYPPTEAVLRDLLTRLEGGDGG